MGLYENSGTPFDGPERTYQYGEFRGGKDFGEFGRIAVMERPEEQPGQEVEQAAPAE